MATIGRCDRCKEVVDIPQEHMARVEVLDWVGRGTHKSFTCATELCVSCTTQLGRWLKEAPPKCVTSKYDNVKV